MIELDIKYKNFNGKPVSERFSFHLHAMELGDLEVRYPGGFIAHFRNSLRSDNRKATLDMLKDLVMMSVGRRSDDDRRFIKTDELRADFEQCGAYSALVIQLASEQISPTVFFNGIMPSDLAEQAEQMSNKLKERGVEDPNNLTEKDLHSLDAAAFDHAADEKKPTPKLGSEYTVAELVAMPDHEYKALVKAHEHNMPKNLLLGGFQRAIR